MGLYKLMFDGHDVLMSVRSNFHTGELNSCEVRICSNCIFFQEGDRRPMFQPTSGCGLHKTALLCYSRCSLTAQRHFCADIFSSNSKSKE